MSVRRLVLLVTCLVVAGLAGVFAGTQWDRADRVATVASALAAVASVGVAVWAGLPRSGSVRVSDTGNAVAGAGGMATTGLAGPATELVSGIEVDRTGDADASGGGDATSGVRLT